MENGKSPISPKNNVPPRAASNHPARATVAPVNEPRSWPNSSLSTRLFEKAPQFTATKGPSARGLSLCTCLAISSLPVPVSPVTSTFAVLGPIKWIRSSSALDLTSSNTRADALRLKGATGGAGKLRSGLGAGESDIKPYYIHRHNRILRRPCQGNRNLGIEA